MCGFVGVCSVEGVVDKQPLVEGQLSLQHRGPDAEGSWWSSDGKVGLYHRRLKIVDLSVNAAQPMVDHNSGVSLVFNGEIYNHSELRRQLASKGHQFRSSSDTEVILRGFVEWGDGIIDKLVGMFALAICDTKKRKVYLARDRAGEKPLFYRYVKNEIRFASELKALLTDQSIKKEVDLDALNCFLYMGFVPGDRCIFSSFAKLKAGHLLEFDLTSGQVKIKPYWTAPRYHADGNEDNIKVLASQLDTILEKAVSEQLVADVPVGILLSGGLDFRV